MRVGEIEITPLSDGEVHIAPTDLLSKTAEEWKPFEEFLDADGLLPVNFGGFLVRTPGRLVVVDTGIGGGAQPELQIGCFPRRLEDAGVAPGDVTDVVFTHLHFDHVGWSTDGQVPLFAGAKHHCHAIDWNYWCGPRPAAETARGERSSPAAHARRWRPGWPTLRR